MRENVRVAQRGGLLLALVVAASSLARLSWRGIDRHDLTFERDVLRACLLAADRIGACINYLDQERTRKNFTLLHEAQD